MWFVIFVEVFFGDYEMGLCKREIGVFCLVVFNIFVICFNFFNRIVFNLYFVIDLFMDYIYYYWFKYFFICGGYSFLIVYVYGLCYEFGCFVGDCLFFVGEVMSVIVCVIVYIVMEIGLWVVWEVCGISICVIIEWIMLEKWIVYDCWMIVCL